MNFIKKSIAPLFLLLAIAATFGACKKYEEGPGLSLRSPEVRIEGTWKVFKATDKDGNDFTADFNGVEITFTKDGVYKYAGTNQGVTFTATGTWSLNSDKTMITTKVSFDFGGVTITDETTSTILRLTKKEFWILTDEEDEIQMVTLD